MKRLFLVAVLFLSFLFSGCIEVVEYITKPYSNFEDGGTKVTEAEYFKNGKKTSDWLFIHYMAGDNNLDYILKGSPLFKDLNEIESGIFTIRNDKGDPKTNCDSVNYVVLFDGVTGGHASTHIYDVGTDNDDSKVGLNTIDITDVSFLNEVGNEANMSDYRTLEKFLCWVNNHYEAAHVVFVLGSHGGGPGGASTYINSNRSARLICPDETNAKDVYMSSEEFALAFKNSGYNSLKKLDLMILDICLGAGFEDAYEIKDIAKYSIVSPNSTSGKGHDYSALLELFNNNKGKISVKDFGLGVCNNFFRSYYNSNTPVVYPTITMLDLSMVDVCADKIDSFASMIIEKKNLYIDYLRCTDEAGIYYRGNCNTLFDAGHFAVKIYNDSNTNSEIKTIIQNELLPSLNDMIVFSWRRSNLNSDIDVNNAYGSSASKNSYYGVTLCGCIGLDNLSVPRWYTWYKTNLAFGKRSGGWADLIMDWFGPEGNS